MAYRQTGTEFVLKGFGQFINGLKQINREYNNMNKAATRMGNQVATASAKVASANERVIQRQKELSLARDNVTRITKKLTSLQTGLLGSTNAIVAAELKMQQRLFERTNAENALVRAIIQQENAEKGLESANLKTVSVSRSTVAAIMAKSAALGSLNVAVGVAVGAIRTLWGAISGLGAKIKSAAIWPFQQLADVIKGGVSIAFGVLIRDSIRGAIDQLGRLRDALVKVVAEFQTLEVRIENLVAREMRLSGAATDVASSFEAAKGPAAELSNWIRQLSLKIPFDVTDIANTTAFAMAMGFATDEAKSLTLSIANFAAGMGLSTEKMQSIVFNFGQMKAAGKVTGTEMRDLARGAFLPLTDVLDETARLLGVTTDNIQDFRKQAAAGEVPIDAFFKAFQNVVARDFPGAVERMGKTLSGVTQRFKNFLKTIFGVEILGPIMKRVAESASNALDKLMTPAVQRGAAAIGKALAIAFDILRVKGGELMAALRRLAAAFGFTGFSAEGFIKAIGYVVAILRRGINAIIGFADDLAKKAGERFNKYNQSFAQWGANLIVSLARGMAAAISAVVSVLMQIGQVFKKWLEAHSPPKLLPKLGKWGAAAMAEYMKGWTNIDFGIFDSIADKMESLFRSLPKTILPETGLVPTILEWRDKIAKAIAKGKNIGSIFGGFGAFPEFKKYAKLIVKVAQANKEVEKAQDELNRVTEKYDKILDPLNRQLDRLTDRGDEIDATRRITQLRLILADVNASAGDKERARNEIARLQLEKQVKAIENEKDEAVAAAEDKVSAAEEHLATLEEELEAQEALIDNQIKTNELIKEQLELLERLKEKAGAGGGLELNPEDFDLGEIGIPGLGAEDLGLDIDFTSIFWEAQKEIDRLIDDIIAQFEPLKTQLLDLKQVWDDVFNGLSIKTGEIFGEGGTVPTFLGNVKGGWDTFVSNMYAAAAGFDNAKQVIKDAIGELNIAMSGGEGGGGAGGGLLKVLGLVVAGIFTLSAIMMNFAALAIVPFIAGFAEAYSQINEKWLALQSAIEGGKDNILGILGALGSLAMTLMTAPFIFIKGYLEGFWQAITTGFQNLSDALVGKSIIPEMMASILGVFTSFFTDSLADFGQWIIDLTGKLADLASEAFQNGVNFVQGLWNGVDSLINAFITWLKDKFSFIVDLINLISGAQSPSKEMFKSGVNLMRGLAMGIERSLSMPINAMVNAGSGVVAAGQVAGNDTTNVTNNNFTLNMPTTASPAGVQRAFNVMSVMVG